MLPDVCRVCVCVCVCVYDNTCLYSFIYIYIYIYVYCFSRWQVQKKHTHTCKWLRELLSALLAISLFQANYKQSKSSSVDNKSGGCTIHSSFGFLFVSQRYFVALFKLWIRRSLLICKQDSQCTCKRNIEARSRNRCCLWQAINITYSECVFVALGIQHTKRLRCNVVCGLPGSTLFFHIVSSTARLSGGGGNF